jgi:hypothetical protein
VGLTRSLQAISKKLVVTDSCNALTIPSLDFPHYRATNMEVIDLDTGKFGCFYFYNQYFTHLDKCLTLHVFEYRYW